MISFWGHIGLSLIWMLLTNDFSFGNFCVGLAFSLVVILIIRRAFPAELFFSRIRLTIRLLAYFIRELVVANFQVAKLVLQRNPDLKPMIVAVPLDVDTDTEITMLANLIALTPGSIALKLSRNRRRLIIHVMHADNKQQFIQHTKQSLEARLLEVLR